MNAADTQYLRILRALLDNGVRREGRNGDTYGLFGEQMRFHLSKGFPLLTTKKVHFKSVAVELLWFLRGDTNVQFLHDHGVTIWDEWADETGELGPVYGAQWRTWTAAPAQLDVHHRSPDNPGPGFTVTAWNHIDQIATLLDGLRKDPYGRRHIVTAWNPVEIDQMALPPCHCLFQFHVANGKLSCHLYQRSADWFLGVPFNIASYALLTHLVAREVGLQVGDFVHSFGDMHLYADHQAQAIEQLSRQPRQLPQLEINAQAGSILDGGVRLEHIKLVGYDPHPAIKAEVSA